MIDNLRFIPWANRSRHPLKSQKIRLPWMLIVPFVLQVLPVVAYVGYIAHRNGQHSVEDLTRQLMDKSSSRIEDNLQQYLSAPPIINQIHQDAVQQGTLDINLSRPNANRDRYLLKNMRLFKQLTWISIGTETGDTTGVWRPGENDNLQITTNNASTQYFGQYYATNEQGQRTQLLKTEKPAYDPRIRPWYKSVLGPNRSVKPGTVWNDVYAGFTPGTIFIAASQALIDANGKFRGVIGLDISLKDLQKFLQANRVSQSGQVFIMQRSGKMVANSSTELAFRWHKDKKPEPLSVFESQIPMIRETAQQLQRTTSDLNSIQTAQQFQIKINQQNHFVQVKPFQLANGPEWLIVMVVPEADVMAKIYTGTQTTILLCLIAISMIIGLNTIISRWLTKPIVNLSQASQQMAQGNFDYAMRSPRVQELAILFDSFSQMRQEIQQSRQQLEDYSHSLEDKVRDRTQALEAEIDRRAAAEAALNLANQELHRIAYLDGLTQIPNRRRFDEQLQTELLRLKREQLPLSLILCDVDYFKRYNDFYGHQAGDYCLIQVAQAIAHAIKRPADLVARYGGEEFVILLPNTESTGAIEVAELIQQRIKTLALVHAESEVSTQVTLSLGITTLIPQTETTALSVLTEADQALYQAKQMGRNQYTIA